MESCDLKLAVDALSHQSFLEIAKIRVKLCTIGHARWRVLVFMGGWIDLKLQEVHKSFYHMCCLKILTSLHDSDCTGLRAIFTCDCRLGH